jgi:hypothetical protein
MMGTVARLLLALARVAGIKVAVKPGHHVEPLKKPARPEIPPPPPTELP